jgi:hypothetical protein
MKIQLRNIANSPHLVLVLAWALCLFLYSLNGAGMLPRLSFGLFIFIFAFLLIFILTSFFLKKIKFTLQPAKFVNINYRVLFIVNSVIFLPNFIHSGIPLLNGTRDDDFGIPGLMILAVSFNAFTCIYCFYAYLHTHKKRFLLFVAYCLGLFIMMVSRGSVLETGMVMFFLWMNIKNPALTFKKIMIIVAGALLIFYLFGVAGNYRSINALAEIQNPDNPDKAKAEYSNDLILQIGDASEAFRTYIPGEFFWSYIYLTSPLANLQYNINISDPPFTANNFYQVVVHETMWDFISKRVDALTPGYTYKAPALIIDQLTVSTTLAGGYTVAGWWGMIYIMFFYWIFPVLYLLFISKNPLAVIGVSTLSAVYLFSVFANMFVLSGLSFQIFYPVIIMLLHSIKLKKEPGAVDEALITGN